MFVVFFVVFIDLLGFGIVLPLMPQFAVEFLGGYSAWERGLIIGVLYSSFSLMQFVFSPLWGRWSDRVGRRPVLLISLTGSVVFYALFAFASTLSAADATLALALLLVARVGAGIAGASVSTASAVIADSTTPEKRSKGMALIGAAFGIGFTFGPLIALAGLIWLPPSETDPDRIAREWLWVPGGIASALSALALLIAARKLPETRPLGGAAAPHDRRGFSLGRSLAVLKLPAVGPFIVMYFLAIFAFANFEATLALYTKEVFSFGIRQTFGVFAGVGAVLMVAQGGFYRRLAGKVSDPALMTAGLVLMMVGLVGLGAIGYATFRAGADESFVDSLRTLFYLTTAVAVFGFAFVNPSVAALVSKNADPNRQGEILGVNQSFAALGRILGPLAGSLLFFAHPSHALPFLVAGGVLILVMFLLIGNARKTPAEPPAS
jgi:MFS family permease